MPRETTVFVVDDDKAVLQSFKWLLESAGLVAECYSSADDFLRAYRPDRPGCIVLDVRMPGMSGLELQTHLAAMEPPPPIIFVTGHGDVAMAARAMRAGALDFMEKPFSDQVLLDRINDAMTLDKARRKRHAQRMEIVGRFSELTPRERQIMELVVSGMSNREIAADLRISEKTVEAHRAEVMEKTQAGSLAQLVRMSVMLTCGSKCPPIGASAR